MGKYTKKQLFKLSIIGILIASLIPMNLSNVFATTYDFDSLKYDYQAGEELNFNNDVEIKYYYDSKNLLETINSSNIIIPNEPSTYPAHSFTGWTLASKTKDGTGKLTKIEFIATFSLRISLTPVNDGESIQIKVHTEDIPMPIDNYNFIWQLAHNGSGYETINGTDINSILTISQDSIYYKSGLEIICFASNKISWRGTQSNSVNLEINPDTQKPDIIEPIDNTNQTTITNSQTTIPVKSTVNTVDNTPINLVITLLIGSAFVVMLSGITRKKKRINQL